MKTEKRELLIEEVKGNRDVVYALLAAEHPLFITPQIRVDKDQLIMESQVSEGMYGWEAVQEMILEEKLRHLLNLGGIFETLKDTKYTYEFSPSALVFNRNALPVFLFRGVHGQLPPYEKLSQETFIQHYQAMIISLVDKRYTYETLVNGKLPFYKGDLFCESIAKSESLETILELVEEKYQAEKQENTEHYSRVSNKVVSGLKITTILSTIVAVISLGGVLYLLLFAMPRHDLVSAIRLAFINQDYSTVVTRMKQADSKSLSQEDKYIAAYSVIMTEPLTEQQKEELSKISAQSNEDYLRYWILIGQAKIDEALDIASYLDDPQLLMYGMTKKIDEIQRNPELTTDERTEQLNNYKGKLDELKKTYLTPEEDEGTQSSTAKTSSD